MSEYDWDAEATEREKYADVMAADLADQRRLDLGLAGRCTPRREAATQAGTTCTPRPGMRLCVPEQPHEKPAGTESAGSGNKP